MDQVVISSSCFVILCNDRKITASSSSAGENHSFFSPRILCYLQERRITPGEALNHAFVTLAHLIDYAHCNNVKASVQMMEVCRRAGDFTASPAHHQAPPAPQPPPPTSLVANFVPTTNGSAVTFTFNNQLTNRLVREHRTQTGYDNLVCL